MKPIKQRKTNSPPPEQAIAKRLSSMFLEAGWLPSQSNFADRDYVIWMGQFYSVAGFPDGLNCHSKCCKTEQEVLDFLASFKVEEEPSKVGDENFAPPTLTGTAVITESTGTFTTPEPAKPQEDPIIQELRSKLEAAEQEIASLKTKPLPYPDEGEAQPLPPNPAETKLSEYGEVGADDLLKLVREDPEGSTVKLQDSVRSVRGEQRKHLSELLNKELAVLKNLRGMQGEDLRREADIERLLGLFARLGEI